MDEEKDNAELRGPESDERIVVEDPERSEGVEEKAETKIAKMREELAACRKDKQEYMDGWQRAKADYVNALKRFGADFAMSEFRGKVRAVETLLPAFDALERAKEHVPSEALAKEGGDLVAGFMAVAKQLETAFAALGLEEVGKAGEKFNPAYHEALGQDPTDSLETDDTITAVLEKGWRVSDTVIRPAKVRVAHFAGEAARNP